MLTKLYYMYATSDVSIVYVESILSSFFFVWLLVMEIVHRASGVEARILTASIRFAFTCLINQLLRKTTLPLMLYHLLREMTNAEKFE